MITEKEIEDGCENYFKTTKYAPTEWAVMNFKAGAHFAQEKLLEMASASFDDHYKDQGYVLSEEDHDWLETTWVASRLLSLKEIKLAKQQEYHPLTNPWRIRCGQLMGDIGELKKDLEWVCGMLDNFRRFERVDEIRLKHKLNEAVK